MAHRTQIASYRTERGALNYALELAKVWPNLTFYTRPHPFDFTRTVKVMDPREFSELHRGAYVLRRPRGGPTVQHALIPHN